MLNATLTNNYDSFSSVVFTYVFLSFFLFFSLNFALFPQFERTPKQQFLWIYVIWMFFYVCRLHCLRTIAWIYNFFWSHTFTLFLFFLSFSLSTIKYKFSLKFPVHQNKDSIQTSLPDFSVILASHPWSNLKWK